MKIIFVDAENVGLKELEKMEASILDKVFVFSRVESIKRSCEKLLYLCICDYPSGSNQADFYIIAYLSRVLATLPKEQLNSIYFVLYSNDENLITAFQCQCNLLGGKYNIVRTKTTNTVVELKPEKNNTERLLMELKTPKQLTPCLQDKLNWSKKEFTQAINELVRTKQIVRSTENKKCWVTLDSSSEAI